VRLGDPDPAVLGRALAHPDPEVVKAVVVATAKVPGEAGNALLRAALASSRWDVRLAVAHAVAGRRDPSLRDAVAWAAAADPDPLVARALADASLALAGGR
jgi:HEAT repeat protein